MSRPTTSYSAALRFIAGGVNSPVRAFKSVGGTPVFIAKASGPFLFDSDGALVPGGFLLEALLLEEPVT